MSKQEIVTGKDRPDIVLALAQGSFARRGELEATEWHLTPILFT